MKPNPRIAIPVVLVLAVIVTVVLVRRGADTGTLAGTVEATEAQLGFTVPGRITTVAVHEGDRAKAGDVLAALDTLEAAARARQAEAQVEAARAAFAEMESGSRPEEVQQAGAARDAARQRLTDAQQDFDRAKALLAGAVTSRQSFDKAQVALDVARSQYRQADEQYRLVAKGPRAERVAAARAQLANAQASLAAQRAALANMVIRAPFDGVVTVRHREPGEIVGAGAAVVSLMNRDDRWVRVYVSETRVGAVHTGQKAAVTCDTYTGRRFAGEVTYVSSEAEFTPKNVQTAEERVKLVYAVKVRVSGDPEFVLKPGMPADVVLEAAAK